MKQVSHKLIHINILESRNTKEKSTVEILAPT